MLAAVEAVRGLPPATRAVLLANVAVYLVAKLGLLGSDPAERFGFKACDLLASPARSWHKLLTGEILHLNHAHLVSNMVVLSQIGGELERRLGARRMLGLIAALVPAVGLWQLTLTVVCNALAAACGVHDAHPSSRRGSAFMRTARHQVSVKTISIGFSGVLFALHALATREGMSTMRIGLEDIPASLRPLVLRYFPQSFDRRWGSAAIALPAAWAPLLQVIIAQCSDPERVSFLGHLAGALAAITVVRSPAAVVFLVSHVPSRLLEQPRGARGLHQLRLRKVLAALLSMLPLHLAVWWLGRQALQHGWKHKGHKGQAGLRRYSIYGLGSADPQHLAAL